MPSKSEAQIFVNGLENFVTSDMGKTGVEDFAIKEERDDRDAADDEDEHDPSYPMDLPLEVITTIEPFNYAYPYLKNMSNGVLTHRNIFTEQEREVLRNIVDKYRDIVDTRSRTREIYMEKQNVWQQIVEEYNSTENILVRTEKELKKCWDNMKYRARLAEKEQIKAENLGSGSLRKSPDPHQIACNAVQAALEKMLTMQTQTPDDDDNCANKTDGRAADYIRDQKEKWNNYNAGFHDEQQYSPNAGDSDREDGDVDDLYDYEQPAVKKARQESPKLSSILLGNMKKSPYLKSDSSSSRNHYTIPNCTKVTHIKKKCKKSFSSNPVSILPKGLNSCVSILNIPNPNQSASSGVSNCASTSALDMCSDAPDTRSSGAINLGGGITISPQRTNGLPSATETSSSSHGKPMPCLKKMLPNKIFKNVDSIKKGFKSTSAIHPLFNSLDSNEILFDSDSNRNLLEERILLQRLDFDSQEHTLRMKVLEKQLQAYTNESQYWALKTKMLRNGHTEKMVNGDI